MNDNLFAILQQRKQHNVYFSVNGKSKKSSSFPAIKRNKKDDFFCEGNKRSIKVALFVHNLI